MISRVNNVFSRNIRCSQNLIAIQDNLMGADEISLSALSDLAEFLDIKKPVIPLPDRSNNSGEGYFQTKNSGVE